jgi:hypothetical protein
MSSFNRSASARFYEFLKQLIALTMFHSHDYAKKSRLHARRPWSLIATTAPFANSPLNLWKLHPSGIFISSSALLVTCFFWLGGNHPVILPSRLSVCFEKLGNNIIQLATSEITGKSMLSDTTPQSELLLRQAVMVCAILRTVFYRLQTKK